MSRVHEFRSPVASIHPRTRRDATGASDRPRGRAVARLIRTLSGLRRTLSVTEPVARWTHAVATRALVVPPAWGARRVVSRPTVHTGLARSTLAMSRSALPAEPTVRPWRQLCAARRRQQHDQTCSQNETLKHRSSRTPVARLVVFRLLACDVLAVNLREPGRRGNRTRTTIASGVSPAGSRPNAARGEEPGSPWHGRPATPRPSSW